VFNWAITPVIAIKRPAFLIGGDSWFLIYAGISRVGKAFSVLNETLGGSEENGS